MQNKLPSLEEEAEDKKPSEIQNQSETSTDVSTKSFSEIEEESTIFGSETSTLKDYSGKLEVEKKHSDKTSKQDIIHDQQDQYFKMDNKMKNKVKIEKIDSPASSMKSSESCITKGTSRSTGRSHKLRNLLTCGALDANDSAHVVMINRHNNQNNVHLMEMCKLGEKHIGGSQRISRTTWNQQPWNTGRKSCDGVKDSTKNIGEFCNQRTTRATYKHVKGPNCSQCKKQFKPEKLHAHMKSCKGIKATEKTSQRSI
ncbi:protein UPSTREAM OF FLC [Abeliophyllum distichum]|uniref:Protein UPSTREAM OF FLC n=1 Tax=Abeliophyllum distichum TaxID=126358 RepID=A0ABD1RSM5_9LAMI